MGTRVQAEFAVTSWEERPGDGPHGRVTVAKRYSGPVVGESVAELLTCRPTEAEAGYIASDVFTGSVEGRSGSFVMHHGATQDGTEFHLFGHIVPGSGTGDLAGIRGSVRFEHDADGARFTLDYAFPGTAA